MRMVRQGLKLTATSRLAARVLRDRHAGVAFVTAVTFPLMLGFVGLASEASLWLLQRRTMQGVADAAAYSAAVAIASGNNAAFGTNNTTDCSAPAGAAIEACGVAAQNGYSSGIKVNSPPKLGPYTTAQYGPTGYAPVAEVIITQTPRTSIAAFFGVTSITLQARAVAAVNAASGSRVPLHSDCVLALDPTASGAVNAQGSGSALDGCGLAVNSNSSTAVTTGGGGGITVTNASATLVGGTSASNFTATGGILTNQKPVPDPFAALTVPTVPPGQCVSNGAINNSGTYSPGCYTGIKMTGKGTVVTLLTGTYVINGSIDLENNTLQDCSVSPRPSACPAGDNGGVTIIMTNNGSFNENGGFILQISAPTTGTYAGVAFYQDRADTNLAKINGSSTTGVINGAVYLPSATIDYVGGEGTSNTGCTVLIADQIVFGGSSGGTASFGGSSCSGSGGNFGNGLRSFGSPGLVE